MIAIGSKLLRSLLIVDGPKALFPNVLSRITDYERPSAWHPIKALDVFNDQSIRVVRVDNSLFGTDFEQFDRGKERLRVDWVDSSWGIW